MIFWIYFVYIGSIINQKKTFCDTQHSDYLYQMLSKLIEKVPYTLLRSYAISQIKKRKCWFVDIPRTSSTSIKVELTKTYGIAYGKKNTGNSLYAYPQIFQDHLPAVYMRKILGAKLWDDLHTFSIVRNPWDRMVSTFLYRKQTGELDETVDFKNYIKCFNSPRYGHKNSPHYYHGYYYGCIDYITDEQGEVIVKTIGRYEERSSFIQKMAAILELGVLGNTHLQSVSSSRHYSEYYESDTKDIIARVFQRDIDFFGYEFKG